MRRPRLSPEPKLALEPASEGAAATLRASLSPHSIVAPVSALGRRLIVVLINQAKATSAATSAPSPWAPLAARPTSGRPLARPGQWLSSARWGRALERECGGRARRCALCAAFEAGALAALDARTGRRVARMRAQQSFCLSLVRRRRLRAKSINALGPVTHSTSRRHHERQQQQQQRRRRNSKLKD